MPFFFRKNSVNRNILQSSDLYFSHLHSSDTADQLTESILLDVFPHLQPNLTSPDAQVIHLGF